MKIYTATRFHKYNNTCRENTSVVVSSLISGAMGSLVANQSKLESFYPDSRRYDMLFDWGTPALSFGVLHLSMSILADNINQRSQEFVHEFKELIYMFAKEVVSKFDYVSWCISEADIDAWIESKL